MAAAATKNPIAPGGALGEPLVVPEKRANPSYWWRKYHSTWFLLGATAFATASPLYFPALQSNATMNAAGYVYTLGSLSFLVADATEWFYYRADAVESANFALSARGGAGTEMLSPDLTESTAQALGSALYFVGSVFFIPAVERRHATTGAKIFGWASAIIAASQAWKLVRAHKTVGLDADVPGTFVDALVGVGGLFYFGGSWHEASTMMAAFFTLGGVSYFLAALAMQRRYAALPIPPGVTTSLGPFVPLEA